MCLECSACVRATQSLVEFCLVVTDNVSKDPELGILWGNHIKMESKHRAQLTALIEEKRKEQCVRRS